ncbi:MAG: DJ-1/PfpI family protein [Gemmatimonadota bacterium]|nr:MAG: DJ-1/PfpI family protein [Gemmatimonadota bacterium]
MKTTIAALVCAVFALSFTTGIFAQDINVLALMSDRYGGNTFLNNDNLEHHGWHVTYAGITQTIQPCASFPALPMTVDVLVSDITDITQYDVLAIMPSSWRDLGANVYDDIINDSQALNLVATAVDSGLVVYTVCAGPRILAAANRLEGVTITGRRGDRDMYLNEYEAAGAVYVGQDHAPVIDGNIVTSVRDLHYHVQNIEAVATALENTQHLRAHRQGKKKTALGPIRASGSQQEDEVVWARTFGGISSEGGMSVNGTDDGGFVLCGYTFSYGAGHADMYVIKTDAEGHEEWSQTYGGEGWEYGYSACQTSDGGYIATGYTTSFGAGSKDVYLVKTDANGDVSWT